MASALDALDASKDLSQYRLRTWDTGAGLPNNHVHSILESARGALWLATEEGVARFDGFGFEVFDRATVSALPSDSTVAVAEDRAGTIWVATGGGVVRYESGSWHSAPPAVEEAIEGYVTSLALDRNGRIWMSDSEGGVQGYSDEETMSIEQAPGGSLSGVRQVVAGSEADLWIVSMAGELLRIDLATGVANAVPESSGATPIRAFAAGSDGTVWLGGSSGLSRLHDGKLVRFGEADGFPAASVRAILVDRGGSVWIGTYGAGLVRYRGGRFEQLTSRDGLPSDIVDSLHEDRSGRLWVGTNGGGLVCLSDEPFATYTQRHGLPSDLVWAIVGGADGKIWFGTPAGLYGMTADGRPARVPRTGRFAGRAISTLADRRSGGLWVGLTDGGLLRFEDGWLHRVELGGAFDDASVRAILEDRSGRLWIGTFGLGLVRSGPEGALVFDSSNGFPSNIVTGVREDSHGNVWIATGGGLVQFSGDGPPRVFRIGTLLGDAVLTVHVSEDGSIWTGGYGGVARFSNGRFGELGRTRRPVDETVFSIVEDDRGFFWLGSNHGIVRVSREELEAVDEGRLERVKIRRFGPSDGLRTTECSGAVQNASWRTDDGAIWFGTYRGASKVNPGRLKLSPPPPRASRVEARLTGREISRDHRAPPSRPRELAFRFSAVELGHPEKVRFRYRLLGFDSGWRDAGDRRDALYTNLPHGSFEFQVQAALGEGEFSLDAASFPITLRPVFWERSAFRMALLLLVAGLLLGIYRLRMRALGARAESLEATIRERTRELVEASAREAELRAIKGQLQPHFLMNALNSVVALSESDPKSARYLLYELADVLHLLLERMDEDFVPLADELDFTGKYLHLESVRLGDRLRYEVHADTEAGDIPVPPLLLQPLVENSVKHAILPSTSPGVVAVTAKVVRDRLVVAIRDSGVGFDLEAAREHGYGLELTIRRLEAAYGGGARLEALRTDDGATVRIEIPFAATDGGR